MSFKKFIMIVVLLVFLIIIGIICFFINLKSIQNLGKRNNQFTNSTSNNGVIPTVEVDGKEVRKAQGEANPDMNNITEIKDNFFIEQTNDIYINTEEYLGKTIKIEGYVYTYEDEEGRVCYGVVRNTPGCCGNDGLAGLDFRYDKEYPEVLSWVEVIGVIETEDCFGSKIPVIHAATVTEKEEGTTFVTN